MGHVTSGNWKIRGRVARKVREKERAKRFGNLASVSSDYVGEASYIVQTAQTVRSSIPRINWAQYRVQPFEVA